MLNNTDILSFIISFAILFFALKFISRLRQQDVFKARLTELMQYKEKLVQSEEIVKKAYDNAENEALAGFRKVINKLQRNGQEEKEKLKKLFSKAGFKTRNSYFFYSLFKIGIIFPAAGITAFIVFYFTQWPILYKVLAILASGLMGSYLVDFVLRQLVEMRKERIRKAFPQALDLMVVCTEAGLSLTATVQRVAREISQICPDLGYELALLSIELNMFSDPRKALQNFGERMDSDYFKAIVTNIIQAEQYGTPIAQAMRTIAEQFRLDRLLEAEERAAKLPVLLTLPVMLFIFPCVYIVILGPAVIGILNNIK